MTPLSWLQLVELGIRHLIQAEPIRCFHFRRWTKIQRLRLFTLYRGALSYGSIEANMASRQMKASGENWVNLKSLGKIRNWWARGEETSGHIRETEMRDHLLGPRKSSCLMTFHFYEIGLRSEIRFPDIPGSPLINILPATPIELSWGSFCFHPQRSPIKTMVYCTYQPQCAEQ